MVSVGIDITERELAEEALRIAEENYRSIFENALEGIFQATPDGHYISVNPAIAHCLIEIRYRRNAMLLTRRQESRKMKDSACLCGCHSY
jgi:hypothetical protein